MDPLLLLATQAGGLLIIATSLRRPRTATINATRTATRTLRRATLTVLATLGFATAAALASAPAHAEDDPGHPAPSEERASGADSASNEEWMDEARFRQLLRDLTDEHYANYPDEDPRPDPPERPRPDSPVPPERPRTDSASVQKNNPEREFQGPGWDSHKIEVTKNLGPRIEEDAPSAERQTLPETQ